MSKLIQAINVMVSNDDKISRAATGHDDDEIFFIYDDKHVWSVMMKDADPSLYYYPGHLKDYDDLKGLGIEEFEHIQMVSYGPSDFVTREAKASISELHRIVKEKLYGMDDVFTDIIQSDEIPF